MSLKHAINHRFIVPLDKFSIGLPYAEVIDTKGKYLVFREYMKVDETLYSTCGCSVVDADFINKMIDAFSDDFAENEANMIRFAIKHRLLISEVDGYNSYYSSTHSPVDATTWRNAALNRKHGTVGVEYITDPKDCYFDSLNECLPYGEYRLGVFIN